MMGVPYLTLIRERRASRKESNQKMQAIMRIGIRNFGPITNGEIKLKPFTLFVGPNNSGKSYAAMLIHSIIESSGSQELVRGAPAFMRRTLIARGLDMKTFREEMLTLSNQLSALPPGEEIVVSEHLIKKVCSGIFKEWFEHRLRDEIIRSFACPLDELVQIQNNSFSLEIGLDSYATQLISEKEKLSVIESPSMDLKIKIRAGKSTRFGETRLQEKKGEFFIEVSSGLRGEEKNFISYQIFSYITEICASRILKNIPMPCYYLPAARSGILQGHKALAASIVKRAPSVGIERLEIPKFSGVVADFISSVITLPQERGPFYKLAKKFEKELIKGEIVVRTLDEFLYPEIKYHFQNTEIPLHRASSTVSELAPLFLYLKYSITPHSMLIIEEPEAHLHPRNQRILAKYLVRLVRRRVNVVITTHSDYLIEQLNNFILLSKVERNERVSIYKYDKEDFLQVSETAAYVFKFDRKLGGHRISEIKISEEDGISQEEFLKIHETLYDETIRLRENLESNKS
jgi:predicted ATPase